MDTTNIVLFHTCKNETTLLILKALNRAFNGRRHSSHSIAYGIVPEYERIYSNCSLRWHSL